MIVFLGAGASRPFGIPTMPEFIDIFDREMGNRALYNNIRNSFDRESFDLEVLMTILEDLSKDENELLRTISPQTSTFLVEKMRKEDANYMERLPEPSKAKECLSELKGKIRRICFHAVQNNVDTILKIYDQLFRILRSATIPQVRNGGFGRSDDDILDYPANLKIFTTNYDTCVETFLNRHQISFNQGIVRRYGYNVFDVDSFGDKSGEVDVFKLHGSVDLFRKNGEIRQLSAYTPEGSTYLGEDYGEELMRYPIEFGGYRHVIESPYLDLFRLFRDRIRLPSQRFWLLIGSSFRDVTICSIMNDVLRLKERGKYPLIILVNPSAKAIVARLKEWGMTAFAELVRQVEEEFGTDECVTKLRKILAPPIRTPKG